MWTELIIISTAALSLTQAKCPGCADGAISADMAQAINNFSVNLFKAQAGQGQENTVLCPLSLSILLGILEQGAGGNTLSQLENVIGTDPEESREGYCQLTKNLAVQEGNETLEFANACFLQEGYNIYPQILNIVQKDFQSDVKNVDFSQPDEAAAEINEWVAEKTHDLIQDLISPDSLSSDTRLVLTNAIYFKDSWNSSFNSSDTTNEQFYKNENSPVQVQMMHKTHKYPAGALDDLGAKWASLSFQDDRFSMLIVVPNQVNGISTLLSGLTLDVLSDLIEESCGTNTVPREVELAMPKFKLASNMQLIPPLQQLGLTDIFTPQSNLSGISGEGLAVSEIIQQAKIEADEQGAVAAAATGVIVGTTSVEIPLEIKADHPFVASIIDGMNKISLFLCVIFDPTAT